MMAVEGLMVEGGLQLQLSCIEYQWRWCCIWNTKRQQHPLHCIITNIIFSEGFIQELGIECEGFLVFTNSLHRKKTLHNTVHAHGPQCLYNDRQTTHRGMDRLGGCHTYFTYVKIP